MHITLIAGTRPNFVKISPIILALKKLEAEGFSVHFRLVHTGQHYDDLMSSAFFQDLQLPNPDTNLGVGSGTQAEQTAGIMIGFEKELLDFPTDLVLVVGDVNSTMACAVVAKKMNIPLAHVEGGIRSFDSSMPEEINRKITDSITDYFFTTSTFANENLKKEGVRDEQIFFVGNVMIDTLLRLENEFKQPSIFEKEKLSQKKYLVLTLHRPSNVDNPEKLLKLLTTLSEHCGNSTVIFPVHPRTAAILKNNGIVVKNIVVIEPLGYLEFNFLVKNSLAVITDSGGISEETTVMGIPCLTLRSNTERPETCTIGTNVLLGSDPENLIVELKKLFFEERQKKEIPALWDGNAAQRIVDHLIHLMASKI
jgi:UDP-N-acetylglucosamine 2-epimerase (non-hydrolysing)